MAYEVDFTTSAAKELRKLERSLQKRIIKKIEALAENPRPSGSKRLVGSDYDYRIRIGDYRVVYEVHDGKLIVLIVRVRHRKEVYQ
jgi:mRNA interferase RelE/StbE